MDELEIAQRAAQNLINSGVVEPSGQTWTTEELQRDFTVEGFCAPCVIVVRKSDGVRGSLFFRHWPRIYFGWQEDRG